MFHNIFEPTSQGVNTANYASVAIVGLSWTDLMNPRMTLIATTLTAIWMVIQITLTIKSYLDKRELARGPRGRKGTKGNKGDKGDTGTGSGE